MNDFISSVKNTFFSKKVQDTKRNNSDDYMIRKSKKFDIIIKIYYVCVFGLREKARNNEGSFILMQNS